MECEKSVNTCVSNITYTLSFTIDKPNPTFLPVVPFNEKVCVSEPPASSAH
nr:hypothetical protein [Lutibacter sp.]